MQEFIKKLIERLEELKASGNPYDSYWDEAMYRATELVNSTSNKTIDGVIEIVNQLAEEYNNESVNGDLISRSATIKALEEGAFVPDWNLALAQAIVSKQPAAYNDGDGWIPCSERLPDAEADVLLSLRSLDIYVGFMANTEGMFYVEGEGYVEYENVLAWQPLPTPYQQKGE